MKHRKTHRKGFTLMEAMLTTIIVGVGTVAMVQLLAAGTMANADSTDQMQGITLCNNVREMMQMSSKFYFSSQTSPSHWGLEAPETKWTGDDLDDFDGQSFNPPVDGRRKAIDYLSGWSQEIKVESVDPSNVRLVVPHGTQTPDLRPITKVTVTVSHNGNVVCTRNWLVVYAP